MALKIAIAFIIKSLFINNVFYTGESITFRMANIAIKTKKKRYRYNKTQKLNVKLGNKKKIWLPGLRLVGFKKYFFIRMDKYCSGIRIYADLTLVTDINF